MRGCAKARQPGLAPSQTQSLVASGFDRVQRRETNDMPRCFGFNVSNEAILEFDQVHPSPGAEPVPPVIQVGYDVLLFFVDRLFEGKAIERSWRR